MYSGQFYVCQENRVHKLPVMGNNYSVKKKCTYYLYAIHKGERLSNNSLRERLTPIVSSRLITNRVKVLGASINYQLRL